jgi:hypothetical protein
MAGDVDPNATVEHVGRNEEDDPFHDEEGTPVLDDASPFEVGLYAHHCWVLGLDPDRTAALLRGE